MTTQEQKSAVVAIYQLEPNANSQSVQNWETFKKESGLICNRGGHPIGQVACLTYIEGDSDDKAIYMDHVRLLAFRHNIKHELAHNFEIV